MGKKVIRQGSMYHNGSWSTSVNLDQEVVPLPPSMTFYIEKVGDAGFNYTFNTAQSSSQNRHDGSNKWFSSSMSYNGTTKVLSISFSGGGWGRCNSNGPTQLWYYDDEQVKMQQAVAQQQQAQLAQFNQVTQALAASRQRVQQLEGELAALRVNAQANAQQIQILEGQIAELRNILNQFQ